MKTLQLLLFTVCIGVSLPIMAIAYIAGVFGCIVALSAAKGFNDLLNWGPDKQ